MKDLNFLRWVLGGVLGLSLMMTACGKKNDNKMNGNSNTVNGWTSIYGNSCSTGASAIGMIYDDGTIGNFQGQVMGYVSSFMDPNTLGSVSGATNSTGTGIDFKGKLVFSNNQIVAASSGLDIHITDSYTTQGEKPLPSASYVGKAISGTLDPNSRTFKVLFQDKYGYVQISGTYDGSFVTGLIQYQNTIAYPGYSPQSGTLGKFKITQCGLL